MGKQVVAAIAPIGCPATRSGEGPPYKCESVQATSYDDGQLAEHKLKHMQRKQTTMRVPTGNEGGNTQARAGSIHSECPPLDSGQQVVQVEVVQVEAVQVEAVQAGLRGGLG